MILENGDDNNNNTAILKEWQYCDTSYYDMRSVISMMGQQRWCTCYGYVVSSNVGVMMTIWLCMAEKIINDNGLRNMIAVTTKMI